jgi:hypothetical protein
LAKKDQIKGIFSLKSAAPPAQRARPDEIRPPLRRAAAAAATAFYYAKSR